jgi:hypothetical protein
LQKSQELTEREHKDLEILPSIMICYLNGFDDKEKLIEETIVETLSTNIFVV